MAKALDKLSEEELEQRIQKLGAKRDEIMEQQRELKVALSQAIERRYEARRTEVENDPELKALNQSVGF